MIAFCVEKRTFGKTCEFWDSNELHRTVPGTDNFMKFHVHGPWSVSVLITTTETMLRLMTTLTVILYLRAS